MIQPSRISLQLPKGKRKISLLLLITIIIIIVSFFTLLSV